MECRWGGSVDGRVQWAEPGSVAGGEWEGESGDSGGVGPDGPLAIGQHSPFSASHLHLLLLLFPLPESLPPAPPPTLSKGVDSVGTSDQPLNSGVGVNTRVSGTGEHDL